MNKIDEQGYKDGGAAFAKGKSLRSLFEPIIELGNKPYQERESKEDYINSMMLGFADALLTKLRAR